MQCSLCDKVALRVVRTGKKQKGFCGTHTKEAFAASKSFYKPKVVRIYVTKEDIKLGCAGSTGECPVALAIARKFPKHMPRVFRNIFFWQRRYNTKCDLQIATPAKAFAFIQSFDKIETRAQAKPFQFIIEVPECLLS